MLPDNETVAELKRFNHEFRSAGDQPDFGSVPDGKYDVTVDKVEFGRTPTSGQLKITWFLRMTSPGYQNRMLFKSNLITANSVRFMKAELRKCGLAIEDISELPSNLGKLAGLDLAITKRSNNGYENIYIDRRKDVGLVDDLPF